MKFTEWLSKRDERLFQEDAKSRQKQKERHTIVCQRCNHEEEMPFNNPDFSQGHYRCPKCGGPFDLKVPASYDHPKGRKWLKNRGLLPSDGLWGG